MISLLCELNFRFQLWNVSEFLENPKKVLKITDNNHNQENNAPFTISKSDSKVYNYERTESQPATMDILFSATNKISSHARKRYEMQVS